MLYLIQLSLHYCLSQLIFFILSSQGVYWCVLDGADCNRQFVKMHFNDKNPAKQKFAAKNIYTGGYQAGFQQSCVKVDVAAGC